VVKGNHSLDMADLRTALILETQARICEENGWKLYRSDSGNQSSGMRSDIDQTIYVVKRDADGNWIRSEADDARFIDTSERFPKEARFTPRASTWRHAGRLVSDPAFVAADRADANARSPSTPPRPWRLHRARVRTAGPS
jgi:hypothetical protein